MTVFDFVRTKLDIFNVVTAYVDLRRIGAYFKGSCPFHAEKDASFTISPSRQIFFCFGCKKGGDAIAFVAEIEQVSQIEAARYLAEKYAITIPQELQQKARGEPALPTIQKNIYELAHQIIAQWCHQELQKSAAAKEYLLGRGIKQEMVAKFEIGYFPSTKEKKASLAKKLKQEGILQTDLDALGFFNSSAQETTLTSQFEERIIFPIKDGLGRYVGFGGRIFLPGDDRPKYYNSRETEAFIKKKTLFAFFEAKPKGMKERAFFLVEGYLDAILMHQHGYNNCVATLGTACSEEHLSMIERMAQNLFVVYDSDEAGVNAVLRLTELTFATSLQIKVVNLNKGYDPAQQLQENPAMFEAKLAEARGIIEFFINTVSEIFFTLSDGKKIEVLEKILTVVQKIPDAIKRYLALQKIAHLTGVRYAILQNWMLKKCLPKKEEGATKLAGAMVQKPAKYKAEEILFFAQLAALKKDKNAQRLISVEFYELFSQRLRNFFAILEQADKLNQNEKEPVDVVNYLLLQVPEEEKSWIWEGFLWFDASFDVSNLNLLFQQLYLQYAREKLRCCDRTANLDQETSPQREKVQQLLVKIKSLGKLLNLREDRDKYG